MAARYTESHDDMLGEVRSSLTGATQWDVEAITGTDTAETGFYIGALDTSGNDFFQTKIQVPHRRKLGSVLDSIHIHYVLQAASNLNDTVTFTGSYCWVSPTNAIPASAGWTAFSGAGLTLNLGAAKAVRYYGIHSIQSSISAPASEGYGGMILIRITRSGGTYAGKLGILDCDAHTIVDRKGSVNEATD
jgi:hypothetical protein